VTTWEKHRRLVLILGIMLTALIGGAVAWRRVPPRESTMAEIRTVINSYQSTVDPPAPAGTKPGERLTKVQRAALERKIADRLRQLMAPHLYEVSVDTEHLPHFLAGGVAAALLRGLPLPRLQSGPVLEDVEFVERTLGGDVVVRVVRWTRTLWGGESGPYLVHEFIMEKTDGGWRIAGEMLLGMTRNGEVVADFGL
jgi:hypothetical protein